MARLRQAGKPPRPKKALGTVYRRGPGEQGITVKKAGKTVKMEFSAELSEASLRAAFESYLAARRKG
jgi:hypothetical protein